MTSSPYFQAWRKYRDLTQRAVADRLSILDDPLLPSTEASLSRIETGNQPYGQRVIEALADIYECEPWELLGRDPFKEGRVVDLVARLQDHQQSQAEAALAAIVYPDAVRRVADVQRGWQGAPDPDAPLIPPAKRRG